MRETGLRPGTLQRLRAPDGYRPGSRFLKIHAEADKARYEREVPLTSRAREVLDEVCPTEGIIFRKFAWRYPLRTAALAAGLDPDRASKVKSYDFRHSVATELTERSGNLLGVGYLLGHRHATSTNQYAHARRGGVKVICVSYYARVVQNDSLTVFTEGQFAVASPWNDLVTQRCSCCSDSWALRFVACL